MPGDGALSEADLARILARAARASGIDFSSYRISTMQRRSALRVALTESPTIDAYLARLEEKPEEMTALLDALLIKTTWMYREPRTFDFLRTRALPELFTQRAAEGAQSIRAWVPACSSGEEAYTLAMCLDEARTRSGLEFQVIASDVDEGALAKVKAACYPETSFESLPPELVAKYLVLSNDHEKQYGRITDDIRSRVAVARHDALRSPRPAPLEAGLASFDIVSCRNLLVYLKPEAHDVLIARLVKTCMQDSLLVISDSESLRTATRTDEAAPSLAPIEAKIPVFRVV